MNTIQKGVIILLRSAITGEALPLPEGFQLADMESLVHRHSLSTLAYAGAVNCGLDKGSPEMQHLFSLYCKALQQSEAQLRQLNRLYAAFEEAGIDYLPLKGCKMKGLYPRPELRLMGDADILIRMEQYRERTVHVMEGLGFQFRSESDHELVWQAKGLYLELHKHLIPSYNRDLYSWFGDGWKLALPEQGTRYQMTPEAEWIFLLTHFAKHFRDGGIGCRHVVDLWVYRRSHPQLQEAVVCAELDKIGLLDFYRHICRLIQVWFAEGTPDERSDFLTDYIFFSGNWGRMDSRTLSQNLRGSHGNLQTGKSRVRYLLRAAFPDGNTLKEKYTILKTAPWMLPLVWLYRPFYKLLFERDSVKRHQNNLKLINQENLDQKVELLHYVGLSDDF